MSACEGTWLCSCQQLIFSCPPPPPAPPPHPPTPLPMKCRFSEGRPPLTRLPGVGNHSKPLAYNSPGYDLHGPTHTHTQSGVRFGQHAHPQQVSVRRTRRGGRMCLSVSCLDQYRVGQLPSYPHPPRGLVGQLHMLRTCSCSSKRALIFTRWSTSIRSHPVSARSSRT